MAHQNDRFAIAGLVAGDHVVRFAAPQRVIADRCGDADGLQFIGDLIHSQGEHVHQAAIQIDVAGTARRGLGAAGTRQRDHKEGRQNQQNGRRRHP